MIIKNYIKTVNALYDSVLNLSIEYVKQYNLYGIWLIILIGCNGGYITNNALRL